ncbi:hypothetical protein CTAYLR_008564 [Chrysophaeum taylorii]|uniref:Uncharacterized protein n=1 Tax=Chrysophaeum taylorii TaxID=2483200 RepID=A0AAD7XFB6_9STRA|nr:hypothetical protein CTAYLR_008564 [Chrysophaeum taylorii]
MKASAPSKFGFCGIGIMGRGMAQCLLKEGRSLVVWNRDVAKAAELAAMYPDLCSVAESPGEVVAACDVTFCMLSTLEASEAVFPSVLEAVCEGKSIVDCATLTPQRMIEMRDAVAARQGAFLEAPVSGSKGPAETGNLIFLCGGDRALYEVVRPELGIMGKANFYFGEIGAGSKMKLVVNQVMGDMMCALGEGLALAQAAGLPCDNESGLLKVLELGVVSNPMFKLKGPKMLEGNHAPNFPLKHAQKDLRFALQLGDDLDVALPLTAAANAAFLAARKDHGDDDFSAVYETQKPPSNSPP